MGAPHTAVWICKLWIGKAELQGVATTPLLFLILKPCHFVHLHFRLCCIASMLEGVVKFCSTVNYLFTEKAIISCVTYPVLPIIKALLGEQYLKLPGQNPSPVCHCCQGRSIIPYTFVRISCFLWGLSTWCGVPCRGSLQETREIYMQDYWPSMEVLCLLPNRHPLPPLIIFLSSSPIFLSDFLLMDFLISAVTIIPRRASQFWLMRHEQYDTHM